MASGSKRNVKTDGLFLGIVILALAVSLILWHEYEMSIWVVPCMILSGIGAYLVLASFLMPKTSKVGPSKSSYYFVNGVIITALGVLGLLYILENVSILYLVAAFLIIVALLIIGRSLSKKD